jgi:hypothetical protein
VLDVHCDIADCENCPRADPDVSCLPGIPYVCVDWTKFVGAIQLAGKGFNKSQGWPFRAPEALLIGYCAAVVGHSIRCIWIVMFQTYSPPTSHRTAASQSPRLAYM